jgi:ribonuclease HI
MSNNTPNTRKPVTIWTDGACLNNPGIGGYGVVLRHGKHRKVFSAGYRSTTNNRMELMAAIVAFRALKYPCNVKLLSDSRYLVDGFMDGKMEQHRAGGWPYPVPNVDLWEELLHLAEAHEVRMEWVPAHRGIEENEACNDLARQAALSEELLVDEGYENRTAKKRQPTLFDAMS